MAHQQRSFDQAVAGGTLAALLSYPIRAAIEKVTSPQANRRTPAAPQAEGFGAGGAANDMRNEGDGNRTSADQNQTSLDEWSGRTHEPDNQGSNRQTLSLQSHEQLENHLDDFINAYNYGRRLKTLKGLTPYEYICKSGQTIQKDSN
jgi:hypothetical protein